MDTSHCDIMIQMVFKDNMRGRANETLLFALYVRTNVTIHMMVKAGILSTETGIQRNTVSDMDVLGQ